jgi:hypothetical protein
MKFSSSEITQMIVAIIGLIGLIFQGIVTYMVSNAKDTNTKNVNKTIAKVSQRLNRYPKKYRRISLIIALLFLTITIPGFKTLYIKYYVEPYITIDFPKENQQVDASIDMSGKYKNINQKDYIGWIVVYSYIDNKYFFHSCPVNFHPIEKNWTNNKTVIGLSNDKNEKFNILFILVNSNSKTYEELLKYLNDKNSHGLDKLPDGIQILKEISVYIK